MTAFTDDQLRDFARRVIETNSQDPDFIGVSEQLFDQWQHLDRAEYDRVHRAVYDLACSATITVSWGDEESAS